MVTSQFKYLFSPFQLGNITLPNRIVSTAHASAFADNGVPGPQLIAYQEEKARGGCGLVICYGSASVHHTSPGVDWGGVELYEDRVIPHLKKAAAAVHRHGSKVISQITHRGRRGVTLSPNTAVKEIREDQVVLKNVYSEEERVIDGVSTIVYAGLRKAEDSLYTQLKGRVAQLFLVGDAMAPRKIHDAILEGTRAGRQI